MANPITWMDAGHPWMSTVSVLDAETAESWLRPIDGVEPDTEVLLVGTDADVRVAFTGTRTDLLALANKITASLQPDRSEAP